MITRSWGRIAVALTLLAVLVYGALLIHRRVTAVGGSDSSGYANAARLIRSGRVVEPMAALDQLQLPDRFAVAFTPLAFQPGPRPRTMVPFYPPGFPLHIVAASFLMGEALSPYVVSPLAALICLLLTYLLGRELGLSRPLAGAGAAILAGCPVFLFQAVQTMSDIVATAWVVAAVLFSLRARRHDGWALAAGAALGIAILVRPANSLVLIALGFALPRRPSTLVCFLAGGLPFAAFFLAWNRAAYGGYFQTGYSAVLGTQLAPGHFVSRFRHYGYWVTVQLSPLVPLGWMAVIADRHLPGRDRALLVAWFASFLVFYCFWGPYEFWWYTRFLLPAMPAAIVGFLIVVQDAIVLLPGRVARGPVGVGIVIGLGLVVGTAEWRIARRVSPLQIDGFVFSEGCQSLAARAPKGNALVVSMEFSGALRFHTNLTPVRWDRIAPADFAVLRAKAAQAGWRIFAILLEHEVELARPHVPGNWIAIESIRTATLWELQPEGAKAARCPSLTLSQPEICNGVDDDCNGVVDDVPRTSYTDEPDRNISPVALQTKNSGCDPPDDSTWRNCNNAIHLYCRDVPCRTTGLGPLEWGPSGRATVACLKTDQPREVVASDLAQFESCAVGSKPVARDRFDCARAIHGFCRNLGYASGFGPVGAPRPATWSVICLRAGHATVLGTSYSALQAFHGSCTGRNIAETNPTFCTTAAKRYCVDHGHVAGFGPVADPDGDSPLIVCLDD